uniref:Uncharacterized protein n=1 Tax=Lepeophtheirus salmonis TaxID=72036 RepID=A0A0K2VC87_LEPSM
MLGNICPRIDKLPPNYGPIFCFFLYGRLCDTIKVVKATETSAADKIRLM